MRYWSKLQIRIFAHLKSLAKTVFQLIQRAISSLLRDCGEKKSLRRSFFTAFSSSQDYRAILVFLCHGEESLELNIKALAKVPTQRAMP